MGSHQRRRGCYQHSVLPRRSLHQYDRQPDRSYVLGARITIPRPGESYVNSRTVTPQESVERITLSSIPTIKIMSNTRTRTTTLVPSAVNIQLTPPRIFRSPASLPRQRLFRPAANAFLDRDQSVPAILTDEFERPNLPVDGRNTERQ